MQRFLVCSKIIDFDIHRFTLISNDGERESSTSEYNHNHVYISIFVAWTHYTGRVKLKC